MEREEWRKTAIAGALVVLFTGGSILWQSYTKEEKESFAPTEEFAAASIPQGLKVYVSGAVDKPGIYEVPAGSRAEDAIAAAGGLTEAADRNKVNLAKKCKDGMQVNVPEQKSKKVSAGQAGTSALPQAETGSSSGGMTQKVNLNTANKEELETLPGVGEATAEAIIEYRAKQQFSRVEDVIKVKGIGPAKLAKMQALLEV